MTNYRVYFYKKADKEKPDEKDEYLGLVTVDDCGVNQHKTLTAKAFQWAPSQCLMADKVVVEKV